jgi:chromosome segregation ATPase
MLLCCTAGAAHEALEKRAAESEARYAEATLAMDSMAARLDAADGTCDRLEKELAAAHEALAQAEAARQTAARDMEGLAARVSEADTQRGQLEARLAEAEARHQTAVDKLESLTSELGIKGMITAWPSGPSRGCCGAWHTNTARTAAAEASQLRAELADVTAERQEIGTRLVQTDKQLAWAEEQLRRIPEREAALQREADILRNELTYEKSQHRETVKNINTATASLNRELDERRRSCEKVWMAGKGLCCPWNAQRGGC